MRIWGSVLLIALATLFVGVASAPAMVTSGYIAWNPAIQPAGLQDTPHLGYSVSTQKCTVCHSVHSAPVPGTAWFGDDPWAAQVGGETQMLLRSSVQNACSYCHIETSIGGVQLYAGNDTLYNNPGSVSPFAENVAHNAPVQYCQGCHSVHGANTYHGPAGRKLLKYNANAMQDEIIGRQAGITGIYASATDARDDVGNLGKDAQVSVFCTQCHPNFSPASETTLNANGTYEMHGDPKYVAATGTGGGKMYKSHPMKTADAVFAANGSTTTTQVAWAGSSWCRSCHDAGVTDAAAGVYDSSFPHYTAGAYYFMTAGANVASKRTGAETTDTARSEIQDGSDGHCTKCHVNADGSQGVGVSF